MILTVNDLCKRYQISKSTAYKFIRRGALPKGFTIGGKSRRWLSEELDEFDRAAAKYERKAQ